GRYIVGLTADHGVCPLPEVAKSQGKDAGRIDVFSLYAKAQSFLEQTFGKTEGNDRWIEATPLPWVYLNRKSMQRRGLKLEEVEIALAAWLEKQPGILKAYTESALSKGLAADDRLGQAVLKSYYPERTGDVILIPKPYYLLYPLGTGTTHGTPHDYDTH